jgi:hypothetical protein
MAGRRPYHAPRSSLCRSGKVAHCLHRQKPMHREPEPGPDEHKFKAPWIHILRGLDGLAYRKLLAAPYAPADAISTACWPSALRSTRCSRPACRRWAGRERMPAFHKTSKLLRTSGGCPSCSCSCAPYGSQGTSTARSGTHAARKTPAHRR